MAEITKSLSVDVAKKNTFQAIVAKQGDTASRFLKIQLMNEGEPISVDSSSSVLSMPVEAMNSQRPFWVRQMQTEQSQYRLRNGC